MSVAGYFGSQAGDLPPNARDLVATLAELPGDLSVPKASAPKAHTTTKPQRGREGGDYDAVLRAHCRLDKEG